MKSIFIIILLLYHLISKNIKILQIIFDMLFLKWYYACKEVYLKERSLSMVHPTMNWFYQFKRAAHEYGAPHHELFYQFKRAAHKYGAPHHEYTYFYYLSRE